MLSRTTHQRSFVCLTCLTPICLWRGTNRDRDHRCVWEGRWGRRVGVWGYGGGGRRCGGGGGELYCHHQNDYCVKTGSGESHNYFKTSVIARGKWSHNWDGVHKPLLLKRKGEPKRRGEGGGGWVERQPINKSSKSMSLFFLFVVVVVVVVLLWQPDFFLYQGFRKMLEIYRYQREEDRKTAC